MVNFNNLQKEYYMNTFIIYCSPAGSTKHVAQVIGTTLDTLGHHPVMLDLCNTEDAAAVKTQISKSSQDILLFIGSPVYAFHAVPPVMEFIEQLPDTCKGYSVPFVTWGAVTSGIALHEMGKLLSEKGFPVIGAAKIVAAHSLMWQFAHPLGEGRPDADDDQEGCRDWSKRLTRNLKRHLSEQCRSQNSIISQQTFITLCLSYPSRQHGRCFPSAR